MQSSVGPRRESGSASVVPSIAGSGGQTNGTWVRVAGTRWHQRAGVISLLVPGRNARFAKCPTANGGVGESSCVQSRFRTTAGARRVPAAQPDRHLRRAPVCARLRGRCRSRPSPGSCACAGGPVTWRMGSRAPDRPGLVEPGFETGSRGRSPAGLRLFCSPGARRQPPTQARRRDHLACRPTRDPPTTSPRSPTE
jgi:hypothetical protein